MSAAVVESDGTVRGLDSRAGEPISVVAEDVADAARLARMLQDVRRELAEVKRWWHFRPRFYKDLTVDATGTTTYRLRHGLGRAVFWWPVRWTPSVAGTEVRLSQHASTDENTIALVSGAVGIVTICVVGEG